MPRELDATRKETDRCVAIAHRFHVVAGPFLPGVYRTGGLQPMPGYMPIGNRESGCTTEQAASE
jgi:hypothetical protein